MGMNLVSVGAPSDLGDTSPDEACGAAWSTPPRRIASSRAIPDGLRSGISVGLKALFKPGPCGLALACTVRAAVVVPTIGLT